MLILLIQFFNLCFKYKICWTLVMCIWISLSLQVSWSFLLVTTKKLIDFVFKKMNALGFSHLWLGEGQVKNLVFSFCMT